MDRIPVIVPPLFPADPSRVRLARIVLSAVVAFSTLFSFTGSGRNQAAHFGIVRAIPEHGAIRIVLGLIWFRQDRRMLPPAGISA